MNRFLAACGFARFWPFAMILLALALFHPRAFAHDLGATSVACSFNSDGSYLVAVTIDREHLPPALKSIDEQQLTRRFLDQAHFKFDGVIDRPAFCGIRTTEAASLLAFDLRGRIPAGARTCSFACSLESGEFYFKAQNQGDEEAMGQWLTPGKISEPFALKSPPPALSTFDVIRQYLALGFTHIVPGGLDHILFVLGLFLLSMRAKPILMQVTAFTVAHSITLGLSMYGVVSLPSRIVEPLIALSIAYIAIENIFVRDFKTHRTAIVFGFGLLHGMGFAGVLHELGLPRAQFVPALVSFNVGVELGQLSVIAAAFLAVGLWFGQRAWYRWRVTIPASAMIALTGLYWTIERVMA